MNNKKQKGCQKNRAFTLIELIVVMAIIGVLVLLAAPRFLNKTQQAKVANIKNDVKVVEGLVEEYLIRHDSLPVNGAEKSKADLEALDIYDTTGPTDIANEGPYKLIGNEIIEPANTQLKGNFYGNDKGKVYYEDNTVASGGGTETPVEEAVTVPEAAKASAKPIGAGTIADPYQLWFLENIDYIRTDVAAQTSNYVMMRSLDFTNDTHYIDSATNKPLWTTGLGWAPIVTFSGVFDGNNKELSNLFMNRPTGNVGLFAKITGTVATVKNIGLTNVNIVGGSGYTGAFAGVLTSAGALLDNVYSSGSITGTDEVGGLIGDLYESLIRNSHSTATITGDYGVGGLIGYAYASGLTISDSYYAGTLNANGAFGGLIGDADKASIENSYSSGNLTSSTTYAYSQGGGLVGNASYRGINITRSYSTANVTGASSLGGLVGYMGGGTITDSYAWGNVTDLEIGTLGNDDGQIGGIVGTLDDGDIFNSYSKGVVSGSIDEMGGIAGYHYVGGSFATNSYYLNLPAVTPVNPLGTQLDAAEMSNQASFAGWDFSAVWSMQDGFPVLQ